MSVTVGVWMQHDPPADVTELVYRVVEEALRNVECHAAAQSVVLEVCDDGRGMTVRVEDDGPGVRGVMLEDDPAAHVGLRLLAEGVAARGGSLQIESEAGSGTRVKLALPWGDPSGGGR
jgi:two-component system NarL family sensor kinase